MALPTTNLTAHFNASDNDHLFEDLTKLDSPEDGDNVAVWTDDDAKDLALVGGANGTASGDWVSTPLILPAVDFDPTGTERFALFDNTTLAVAQSLDVVGNNNAKTCILSLRVKSASLNDADAYENHLIIADANAYWGLYLRTSGGQYFLIHYNWDGNQDRVEKEISINTIYIVTLRHDGTNVYIGLDGAAESSAASGNTQVVTGQIAIGAGLSGEVPADILIGELAFWDAALTSTDLTDANAYFTDKWLAAAPPADNVYFPPHKMFQQAVQRGAFF